MSRKHRSDPPADSAAACRNWLPWRDAHCTHDKEGWNHQEPGGRDVDITSQWPLFNMALLNIYVCLQPLTGYPAKWDGVLYTC